MHFGRFRGAKFIIENFKVEFRELRKLNTKYKKFEKYVL